LPNGLDVNGGMADVVFPVPESVGSIQRMIMDKLAPTYSHQAASPQERSPIIQELTTLVRNNLDMSVNDFTLLLGSFTRKREANAEEINLLNLMLDKFSERDLDGYEFGTLFSRITELDSDIFEKLGGYERLRGYVSPTNIQGSDDTEESNLLIYCVENSNREEQFDKLIEWGADPLKTHDADFDLASLAIVYKPAMLERVLKTVKNSNDFDSVLDDGRSFITRAIAYFCENFIREDELDHANDMERLVRSFDMLREQGLDLELRDKSGQTVLDIIDASAFTDQEKARIKSQLKL